MKPNIGTIDRTLRIILGLGLLTAGFVLKTKWGLVGLVPLLTAFVRFCPLYPIVGINTCKKQ